MSSGLVMTVNELVQLYAPLAGLLGVVFWLGVLSEKVSALKTKLKELENKIEKDEEEGKEIVRLQVKVDNLETTAKSIQRSVEGIQRQLGNLMTGKSIKPFSTDNS
jgi:predicted ATP-grasp superfamily ATP-dependent carboligase